MIDLKMFFTKLNGEAVEWNARPEWVIKNSKDIYFITQALLEMYLVRSKLYLKDGIDLDTITDFILSNKRNGKHPNSVSEWAEYAKGNYDKYFK